MKASRVGTGLQIMDVLAAQLGGTRLMFMQSNGGLTDARLFHGKDSILSGPAGGIVGAVRTSTMAGFDRIIGFDMGGTSTDVSHYAGEFERTFETQVAGVRMRAPMMRIHTVAAGGGSICVFDGSRYRVGPESAGANPGPACYRRGGPLTVTDCNVMLGKLHPDFFPRVFGPGADQPLDADVVREKFAALADEIRRATGDARTPEEVAEGFLKIAVENMANAIKQISVQRGYDVTGYTLTCFGGAGGQHACLVADALGMRRVFIHPHAGVLSAYGMGLADTVTIRERAVEAPLEPGLMEALSAALDELEADGRHELSLQDLGGADIRAVRTVHLKYQGTDTALAVDFGDMETIHYAFETAHRQRYGFAMAGKPLVVEAVSVEVIGSTATADDPELAPEPRRAPLRPLATLNGTPVFDRTALRPGDRIVTGITQGLEQRTQLMDLAVPCPSASQPDCLAFDRHPRLHDIINDARLLGEAEGKEIAQNAHICMADIGSLPMPDVQKAQHREGPQRLPQHRS